MTTVNLDGTGLSGYTGSGNYVGATSPTLITPLLGTPTSGVLTNCTGLPSGSVLGVSTNSNASAGILGEVVSGTVSALSISSGVSTNAISISLTAGDWDVFASMQISPAASTTTAYTAGAISIVSATLPSVYVQTPSNVAAQPTGTPLGTIRVSVASTTSVYCVVNVGFSVSTCTISANIYARRAR